MKNLLPIGSVVLLKDATKKMMIIGIFPVSENGKQINDYLAVPYPEGYVGLDNNFVFNNEDINDVIFTGYANPERDSFINAISILYDEEIKNGNFA